MTIKPRIIVILAVAVFLAMIAEWKFVAFMTETRAIHNYHGNCNGGVGEPYADFVHQLRTLSESGDTNALARALLTTTGTKANTTGRQIAGRA